MMSSPTADFGTFKVYFGLQGSCTNDEWKRATEIIESAPQLAAENAKLREALDGMLEWFGKYPEFVPSGDALESGKIDAAIQQARAALDEPR